MSYVGNNPNKTTVPAAGMVKSNGTILQAAAAGTDYPSVASVTAAQAAADAAQASANYATQHLGFKNILINGEVTRINQRNVANWAAVANGAYGYDRWKKVDASNMTQIIEAGNFVPGAVYTLSGTGVTTQQLTAPASGNWTLPNIPITATNIQLELGNVATLFEKRPIGFELQLCQRYYCAFGNTAPAELFVWGYIGGSGALGLNLLFPVEMRVVPLVTKVGNCTVNNTAQPVINATGKKSCSIYAAGATIGVGSWGTNLTGYFVADAEL